MGEHGRSEGAGKVNSKTNNSSRAPSRFLFKGSPTPTRFQHLHSGGQTAALRGEMGGPRRRAARNYKEFTDAASLTEVPGPRQSGLGAQRGLVLLPDLGWLSQSFRDSVSSSVNGEDNSIYLTWLWVKFKGIHPRKALRTVPRTQNDSINVSCNYY